MRKLVLLLLLSFPLISFAPSAHKFYVSVTKIEHNVAAQSLQIISKIFIDDLEDVLQARYSETLSLDSTSKDENLDALLQGYLSKKLTIKVNGKDLPFEYIGKRYDVDALDFFLEIPNISNIESLEVTNKILFELFPEQQNIIHIKTDAGRRSMILEKDNPTDMLKFN